MRQRSRLRGSSSASSDCFRRCRRAMLCPCCVLAVVSCSVGDIVRFLIIGCGSMGKRRARCLRAMGHTCIAAYDPREERRIRPQT